MMNKFINKRNIDILLLLVICLVFFSMKSTYAKFIQGYTTPDDIVNYNYDFRFAIKPYSEEENDDESFSTIEEYEIVDIRAHSHSVFNIDISNATGEVVYYGVWYKKLSDIDDNKFNIAKLSSASDDTSGSLEGNATKTTTVVVKNDSDNNLKIKIGVASDKESVKNIGYYDERKPINGVMDNYSSNEANEPVLGNGMIPVTYDNNSKSWVKAISSNKNNNWYDYKNKRWANIVLVKDEVRNNYINASIGSKINTNDVLAFYVWIPRFKYRVWDINRQVDNVKNYSYNALDNGIEIIFENDINNTGNVSCTYNVHTSFDNDFLADSCNYVNNKILLSNNNSTYIDAWYTHPAFKDNLSGFWIGKYETSGSKDNPTITSGEALVNLDLSSMFNTSKLINNYGILDGMDARIIKNSEWGAVSYLAHSIYGLCQDNKCNKVTKDISTSGNITGVYDMGSGSLEYVMGNVSDTSFAFNNGDALDNWNKDKKLEDSYYELYSSIGDSNNKNSYYKTRLGDATSEVTIDGITWNNNVKSMIPSNSNPWIIRGYGYNMFGYSYASGGANENYTFRSVIS